MLAPKLFLVNQLTPTDLDRGVCLMTSEIPVKCDGYSIIENTLTKHQCIEINVNIKIIKDGQNSHCKQHTVNNSP